MFSEGEDYIGCMETIGEDCSESNSKEKDVRSFALRVGEAIWKAIYRLSTRGSKTQSGPWSRNRL